MKLEKTKQIIENAKSNATCLFFSGGMDSLLLLYLAKDLPVVIFASDWTKAQMRGLEKVVLEFGLTLYTYPTRNRYVVPNDEGFSLIDEYGFAGMELPVIRDVVEGETCLADLDKKRFEMFDFGFDTVLVGALKGDKHYLTGVTWFAEEKQQGKIRFVAPLFDWTKEEVEGAIDDIGLRDFIIEDSGEISLCTKCLNGTETFCPAEGRIISPIDFNGKEMERTFRAKFGF